MQNTQLLPACQPKSAVTGCSQAQNRRSRGGSPAARSPRAELGPSPLPWLQPLHGPGLLAGEPGTGLHGPRQGPRDCVHEATLQSDSEDSDPGFPPPPLLRQPLGFGTAGGVRGVAGSHGTFDGPQNRAGAPQSHRRQRKQPPEPHPSGPSGQRSANPPRGSCTAPTMVAAGETTLPAPPDASRRPARSRLGKGMPFPEARPDPSRPALPTAPPRVSDAGRMDIGELAPPSFATDSNRCATA